MPSEFLRRDLLQFGVAFGAAGLASTMGCARAPGSRLSPESAHGHPPLLSPSAPQEGAPHNGTAKIAYFTSFGVDERMIREALAAALARGGDYADVFFQHKVSRTIALEDGAVNRA